MVYVAQKEMRNQKRSGHDVEVSMTDTHTHTQSRCVQFSRQSCACTQIRTISFFIS